jgi:hypothetical protein
LPDSDDQADEARDHQDQADRPQVEALDVEVGCKTKYRAHRDQEDAPPFLLRDAAEKVDGEQDQDDDYEDSYDGHAGLLWLD